MTLIYCAKKDREAISAKIEAQELDVTGPYRFASPQEPVIDHSATRVLMANDYTNVREMYAGIANLELISDEAGEPDETEEETD